MGETDPAARTARGVEEGRVKQSRAASRLQGQGQTPLPGVWDTKTAPGAALLETIAFPNDGNQAKTQMNLITSVFAATASQGLSPFASRLLPRLKVRFGGPQSIWFLALLRGALGPHLRALIAAGVRLASRPQ